MKTFTTYCKLSAVLGLSLAVSSGCETTDGDGVSGSVYYGAGFSDPWYYGGYYDDPDIIVTPPPDTRPPDRPERPPRPEHPIARPPPSAPRPTPMPSIPRTPMPRVRAR